jgi:hypothetical protein
LGEVEQRAAPSKNWIITFAEQVMGMMYSVVSVDCGDGRKIKVAVGELIRKLPS